MFYIQGVGGQVFQGTLEQLTQVPGVLAARPARGINRQGGQPGEPFSFALRRKAHAGDETGGTMANDSARYAQAAAAYTRMLHQETERGPVHHAYQVMSRDVLSLRAEDSVEAAWHALAGRRVRQAPVLSRTLGVVGLVSERDLLTIVDLKDGGLTGRLDLPIGEVMTTPVVCADPVSDIRRVARVLLDTDLTALPVVDATGMLVGIVSRGDILRAALADPPLSLWV